MRRFALTLFLCIQAATALAQDTFKVSVLKEPPPEAAAAGIRAVLNEEGFRIQNEKGQALADIWVRKAIPGSEKPTGPKEAVLLPFMTDGELIGLLSYPTEGHDYRDQSIVKGVYTMRYGLQPVNGDHLGVSTYRDYSLLLPAAKDQNPGPLARKQLEQRSAESAGTSHPAILLIQGISADGPRVAIPSMVRDAEKSTWSVTIPLKIQVKGETEPVLHPVLLVVVGAAPV